MSLDFCIHSEFAVRDTFSFLATLAALFWFVAGSIVAQLGHSIKTPERRSAVCSVSSVTDALFSSGEYRS